MKLLRRKRAEPEPAAENRGEDESPAAESAEDQPLYQQPRDEKGRYLSRKQM
jgi:hypothetical protein